MSETTASDGFVPEKKKLNYHRRILFYLHSLPLWL